jgi:hypothetical protein
MRTFRTWNRVPPSSEWHLSGKHSVGSAPCDQAICRRWATQSDSYLGKRSWVGPALGARRWSYRMSCGSTKERGTLWTKGLRVDRSI